MAGGPVSGGAYSNIGEANKVILPTTVRIAADTLAYYTNMTCLYDPFWVPETDRATLPLVIFHVTGIQEVSTAQVQDKRLLLYEPQTTLDPAEQAKTVRESVLRTVVDNIVRKPRTYTINAVLPFTTLGGTIKDSIDTVTANIAIFMAQLGSASDVKSVLQDAAAVAYSIGKIITSSAAALTNLPRQQSITYINKNSLDAMHERSHLLCMKMWTGFDYKYVAINNMTVDKRPQEDGVFRLTMQVQEMPVLSIGATKSKGLGNPYKMSIANAIAVAQRQLSKPLTVALMGNKHSKSVWGA